MRSMYYALMARANKHQDRAYAVETEASRHAPFLDKEAAYKRESLYNDMAAAAEERARDYAAMAEGRA